MSIISKSLYKIIISAGAFVENKFEKETKSSLKTNEETLFKILKSNCNSEIGLKYKFGEIKSIEEFKKVVPITEYSFYEDSIERMSKGEKNILVCKDVEYFGHTSGTTGKQKLIATTKKSRLVASKYMALLINRFSYNAFKNQWNYGKGLLIADIVMTTYTEGNIPICSATSGGIKGIKPILSYLYTSPIEVMEIQDKEKALYLHLLFALNESNLLYISGVFISNVVDLFRTLEKNYKNLIMDIRKGTISKALNIDEAKREKLNKYLSPNASRADKLNEEFNKGMKGIARRIWPSLVYIATVTGANFSIYDDKLNYYTDSLPVYSPVYAATEATIAINPYVKKVEYVIIPDTVFYEFIPIDNYKNSEIKTLNINELKIGGIYEIVLTSYAGLYRYRIGDVIKVVGFYNNSPSIEFLYRKNQVLNMVSEKTNEEHLTSAIKNTMDKLKLNLVDYTTLPDNKVTPGRYVFYFELKNSLNITDIKMLEKTLDKELSLSNLAYARAVKGKKLGDIKVILVKPNTFNLVKESLFKKGISKNQVKIPRVIIKNKNILDILNNNCI